MQCVFRIKIRLIEQVKQKYIYKNQKCVIDRIGPAPHARPTPSCLRFGLHGHALRHAELPRRQFGVDAVTDRRRVCVATVPEKMRNLNAEAFNGGGSRAKVYPAAGKARRVERESRIGTANHQGSSRRSSGPSSGRG
jgi:hypothetical protein